MNQSLLNETIAKAALLGTERQAIVFPSDDGALGVAVAGLSAAEPNAAVLGAAAMSALYRQAGRLPKNLPDVSVEPCDLDDLPRCTPRAAYSLSLTLNGEYKDLLPEWLDAVAAAKRRVSERYLPSLLEAGRASVALRSHIAPVLGKRGRWLAALNPEWNYAQLSPDFFNTNEQDAAALDETWQSAGRAARAAVITDLRGRDPERARALLESTWAQDSADERATFVHALATGLSLADEPFLEKALDDRGKDVRRTAADVLGKLPGSRLSQRMIERVHALITIKRNLIGQVSLEVVLPEARDKAMERDGIEHERTMAFFGEKAWWLTQMIAIIPLEYWTTQWKMTPAQCLSLASKNEWREIFFLGWGKASRNQQNPEWQETMAQYWLLRSDRDQRPEAFLPSVDDNPALAERLILDGLQKEESPLTGLHPAFPYLMQHTSPWSPSLARAVIESVKARFRLGTENTAGLWQLISALPQFARLVPLELTDEITRDWPEEQKKANNYAYWTGPVQKFCATVQIRYEMLNDIRQMKETDTDG